MRSLFVSLGGAEYPNAPKLRHTAFAPSSSAVAKVLTEHGLGLVASDDHLNLFDADQSWPDQFIRIRNWLRVSREGSAPAANLLIHYVGHGSFKPNSSEYFLTINSTDAEDQGETSITLGGLYRMVSRDAQGMRVFLLLDACFAAAAAKDWMTGSPGEALAIKMKQIVNPLAADEPAAEEGIAILCSSDKTEPSSAAGREGLTQFTDGLVTVLESGDPSEGRPLSIKRLSNLLRGALEANYRDNAILPILHVPENKKGQSLSTFPIFPNRAAGNISALVGSVTEEQATALGEKVETFVSELVALAGSEMEFEKKCDQLRAMGRKEVVEASPQLSARARLGYDTTEALDRFIAFLDRYDPSGPAAAGPFGLLATLAPRRHLQKFIRRFSQSPLSDELKSLFTVRDAYLMDNAAIEVEITNFAKVRGKLAQMCVISSKLQDSLEESARRLDPVSESQALLLRRRPAQFTAERLQLLLAKVTDVDRWTADLKEMKDENYKRVAAFDAFMDGVNSDLVQINALSSADANRVSADGARSIVNEIGAAFADLRRRVDGIRAITVSTRTAMRPASV